MFSHFLFFIILSTGSVFSATYFKRKYEEMLPITCSLIILLLFLCGIFGFLEAGVYLICAFSMAAYLASITRMFHERHSFGAILQNLFTPGFFMFVVFYICLTYFLRGCVATLIDEFSHWADTVKMMVALNDFGTNPAAMSLFPSYPPGMSLFQYFAQKIMLLVNPNSVFSEWRLFFCQQVFMASFIFPFFKYFNWKRPLYMIVFALGAWLAPMAFYPRVYVSVYIDSLLTVLSGAGFAMIFTCTKKDNVYTLNILLTASILVLSKDAGILFASFLVIAYLTDITIHAKTFNLALATQYLQGIAAVAIPSLLWQFNIHQRKAQVVFGNSFQLDDFLGIIMGQDQTYRATVFHDFFQALFTQQAKFGYSLITMPYIALILIFFVACYMMGFGAKTLVPNHRKSRHFICNILMFQTAMYIVGLCLTYLYKFPEHHGLLLVSYERYMNIAIGALWIFIVLAAFMLLNQNDRYRRLLAGLLLSLILISTPWVHVFDLVSRDFARVSNNTRKYYNMFADTIIGKSVASDVPQKAYFITEPNTEDDGGIAYYQIRYCLHPKFDLLGGCIGEPRYEGDEWAREWTPETLHEELMNGDYSFVILYKTDSAFKSTYSRLFANPSEINELSVFRINRQTGLLELI